MRSSTAKPRVRKNPDDRRHEILTTASQLALRLGLEKVTMKLVAEHLEVRPGLISHYFRTIDELLCAAFEQAATTEREVLFARDEDMAPGLVPLAAFLQRVNAPEFVDLGKLWLDARHQSRYRPALRQVVSEQEQLTQQKLTDVIEEAMEHKDIPRGDAFGVATQILLVVDGAGSYVNTSEPQALAELAPIMQRMAEQALGLPEGSLG
ncbi:TetR/AcrR family transcriptional regulator [Glutamicibacter sp. NPDC087344]|uniref:TetR/AcrR family transcriptional regulator n=1 Tax=Glutamicibacter sp. NPDC087344 TaxID=3363994 RepID=UPI0038029F4C